MWALLFLVLAVYFLDRFALSPRSFDGLEYQHYVTKYLVEPDEEFYLVSSIKNNSLLFIPYLKINIQGADTSSLYMLPRRSAVRNIPISLPKRGRYQFPRAEIVRGDFLGMRENFKKFDTNCEVIVYPKAIENERIIKEFADYIGDIIVRRFIMEDPVLTAGFAEYTGREPMKAISWKQSARAGRMMVKTYDYSAELNVSVVLDCNGTADEVENSLSIARTICQMLERKRVRYDFYSNMVTVGSMIKWDYVPEGLGSAHLNFILEGMGRAGHYAKESSGQLLARARGGREMILISPNGGLNGGLK